MRNKKESSEKMPLQSAVRRVLNSRIPDCAPELEEMLQAGGIGKTTKNAVAMAMAIEAMNGNKNCAEWLREASGEKGSEKKSEGSRDGGAVVFISGEQEIKE